MAAATLTRVREYEAFERRLGSEIQNVAHFDLRATQVVDQLGDVNRIDCPSRLQLDNDIICYEEVRLVRADEDSSEEHGYIEFPTEWDSILRQRDGQRVTVHGLEEPKPELVIDIEEAVQKLLRDAGVAIWISIASRNRICGHLRQSAVPQPW
jgi:hypothetical protein